MSEWFYKNMEEEVGPLSAKELVQMVREGIVIPETQLRKDNSPWVPAKDVYGVFEAAGSEGVEYTCPECGAVIPKPPTTCFECEQPIERASANVIRHIVRRSAGRDGKPKRKGLFRRKNNEEPEE